MSALIWTVLKYALVFYVGIAVGFAMHYFCVRCREGTFEGEEGGPAPVRKPLRLVH